MATNEALAAAVHVVVADQRESFPEGSALHSVLAALDTVNLRSLDCSSDTAEAYRLLLIAPVTQVINVVTSIDL